MPLSPKARLGTCEIVGPLGAGGMGEVYRARDLRLGREGAEGDAATVHGRREAARAAREVNVPIFGARIGRSPGHNVRILRESREVDG